MTVSEPSSSAPERAPWALLFIAVCLVASNLRMTLTGVGPLLDDIAADQGVSTSSLGLLASIPLLTWAAISPLAQGLASRIGLNSAIGWSLVVLAIGTVWRSMPGMNANLWVGTVLTGASIAVINVLLPAVIKRSFGRRVPLVTGVYSTLLSGAAAVSAGLVAPIAHAPAGSGVGDTVGWRIALLCTGVAVLPALALWLFASRGQSVHARTVSRSAASQGADARGADASSQRPAGVGRRIWRDPVAWNLALYMGMQSSTFYIWATWLAPLDLSRGTDPVQAGVHVMIFHLCGMIGSFCAPFIARGAMRRLTPMLLAVLAATGAVGIVFVPVVLPLWLVLGGFSAGASLSVSLTNMAQRSADAATAAATSGMSQSVGYLLAAAGPVLFGTLYGATGSWEVPLIVLLVGTSLQFVAGMLLARDRMVFGGR